MDTIKDKIERNKILAELFLKQNKRVYIKDIEDSYFFADILFVGEETIEIQCFAPSDKKDLKFVLYWANIVSLKEYEVKE